MAAAAIGCACGVVGDTALDDALRRVRLGPLHRPNVTLRELVAAYLGQHEAAPSTLNASQ